KFQETRRGDGLPICPSFRSNRVAKFRVSAYMIAITMRLLWKGFFACIVFCLPMSRASADSNVYLLDVPDYQWYAGCFGTACGKLAGYWDRHGMSDFYTGPT